MFKKTGLLNFCLVVVSFQGLLFGATACAQVPSPKVIEIELSKKEKHSNTQFLQYAFHVPGGTKTLTSSQDMLVLQSGGFGKIVFSQRRRDDLSDSIPKNLPLMNWASMLFETQRKGLVGKADLSIDSFQKVLLDGVEAIQKFENRDVLIYLLSGEQRKPFPVFIMLIDKSDEQNFVISEFETTDSDFVVSVVSSTKINRRGSK